MEETSMETSEQQSEEPPSYTDRLKHIFNRFNIGFNEWEDYHWHIKNRVTNFKLLNNFLGTSFNEDHNDFQMAITPHYLSLDNDFINGPLGKMSIYSSKEMIKGIDCNLDPLNEEHQMAVPNLVHRYGDRALVLTTTFCSLNCRYCCRKRSVGHVDTVISDENLDLIETYLKNTPEIKDVILSGGDFLTLNNTKIKRILDMVERIPTVDIIRIGTKVPVVLPQRFNDYQLLDILSSVSKPIYMNTHFNHPKEISGYSISVCKGLSKLGIILGNQSVLLRGVNDNTDTLIELSRGLLRMKVRPYYIYQCDMIDGVEHFRTDVRDSIKIVSAMRGKIGGLGIPTLILDSPGGKGKINISSNNIKSIDDEKVILTNFNGEEVVYHQPSPGK